MREIPKVTVHQDHTVSVRMSLSDAEHVFSAFKLNAESWRSHKWAGFDSDPCPAGGRTDSEVMAEIEVESCRYADAVLHTVRDEEIRLGWRSAS